jgi:DNA ligase-associated metallophosphoesterase
VKLMLAGEAVELLAEKALWWPAERTLFIADLHLGKAASFRALGQPVPSGTTQDNLDRLTALIDRLTVRQIVFLGDFLHAATARQPGVLDPVRQWRTRHAATACLLVRGNHDSHAGDPPEDLNIRVVDEPHRLAGFAACHHPQQLPGLTVLAGHLHPAVTLTGAARDRQRMPAFWRSEGLLVLPAFGAFTGSHRQAAPAGTACYAVGGGRVWPLPR